MMMMMMMMFVSTEGAPAAAVKLYTRIPEVFGSNDDRETGYPD
jgi:hypothetical protein